MRDIVITFIAILCLSLCTTVTLSADDKAPLEYAVKAAFLYNFTKFVEWPEDTLKNQDSLEICIFGSNPFENNLESTICGKTAHGKQIKIIYTSKISEILSSQILFINSESKKLTEEVLSAVDDLPILTVSDHSKFASNGGMIGFYIENKRVRFEINRQAARDAGLSFSSRLLKIARLVQEKG